MDESDFYNLYVENLLKEVTELTKMKVILDTKAQYNDKVAKELLDQGKELKEAHDTKDAGVTEWKEKSEAAEQKVRNLEHDIRQLQLVISNKDDEIDKLKKSAEKSIETETVSVSRRRGNAKTKGEEILIK